MATIPIIDAAHFLRVARDSRSRDNAVKVTIGYVLIGLSAVEDEALTMAMLEQGRWF